MKLLLTVCVLALGAITVNALCPSGPPAVDISGIRKEENERWANMTVDQKADYVSATWNATKPVIDKVGNEGRNWKGDPQEARVVFRAFAVMKNFADDESVVKQFTTAITEAKGPE